MNPEDAAEFMEQEKSEDRFKTRAAIAIACLAALLAITGLGGNNATKEALNENVLASNDFTFFQAKNQRQTTYLLAANELELSLNNPALSAEARIAISKRIDDYRKTVARYESEPETGEGKKELLARAKEHQIKRDHALKQDPYFDYAEALLQIAIVLISVSIVAGVAWLAFLGGALGIVGALLTINGFHLLVEIPWLS